MQRAMEGLRFRWIAGLCVALGGAASACGSDGGASTAAQSNGEGAEAGFGGSAGSPGSGAVGTGAVGGTPGAGATAAGGESGSPDGGLELDGGDDPELCGNGVIDTGELCDTAIPAGEEGACPDSCEPGSDPCAPVVLRGSGCSARCAISQITQPDDGTDGCCPPGATLATDPDCAPGCGDGVLSDGEQCDTAIEEGNDGACPTASTCTTEGCEVWEISGAACQAECVMTSTITEVVDDDGCCPAGAGADNDNDCVAECGNGIVETSAGETCDGNCPTECPASDACQPRELTGSATTCDARCVDGDAVTACISGDGCCPDDCTHGTDADCPEESLCGNGEIDPGEHCDDGPGSPTPCPTSCPTTDACNPQTLLGSATACTARCVTNPITEIGPEDGCCPDGANANNDPDCEPECGNGVVEPGETCDGNCPTSCTTVDACEPRVLEGSALTCDARCVTEPITEIGPEDGCCPDGANANTDPDCEAECGNGIVEPGEECDPLESSPDCIDCRLAETVCLEQAETRGEDPESPCILCMCGDDGCREPLEACYLAEDVATEGPAEGEPKSELCAAVIDCVRSTGCQLDDIEEDNHCVCGNRGLALCFVLDPNGPCADEILAAAETDSLTTLQSRADDTDYAIGRAAAVGECGGESCATECEF